MSTLGPEAAELLGKTPEKPGAAAEPVRDAQGRFVTPQTPAEGAAPSGQPAPTGQMVPLAAVEGEQRASAAKMQRIREALEPRGWQVLDDGNLVPPPETVAVAPATPGVPPRVQAFADALGVDVATVQGAFEDMAQPFAAPIAAGTAEVYKTMLADKDPDYEVYKGDIDKHLNQLPANIRAHPQAVQFAVRLAKADHLDKLVERGMERKAAGQGKVVGRFMEGAAPGTQEGPTPEPFSDQTLEWMKRQGYTAEEIAKAAANREVSRRGQR